MNYLGTKLAVLSSVLILGTGAAEGQLETVQLSKIQVAHRLAGIVVDPLGAAIQNATIELCAADWKGCTIQGTSKKYGRFAIARQRNQNLYYMRISASGFDPLEFKVRLSRSSRRDLRLTLVIAT